MLKDWSKSVVGWAGAFGIVYIGTILGDPGVDSVIFIPGYCIHDIIIRYGQSISPGKAQDRLN